MSNARTATLEWTDVDRRAVDTARVLAMDAVQKVGNGHPGTAMSLAPVAYMLFQKVMRHNPADPDWAGRDRFVLSCGHSSITLYTELYLAGFGLEVVERVPLHVGENLHNRAYLRTDASAVQQQNVRYAMDRMTETIRDAGAVPAGAATPFAGGSRRRRPATPISISTMFNQLACLGVKWNSSRLRMRCASSGGKAS